MDHQQGGTEANLEEGSGETRDDTGLGCGLEYGIGNAFDGLQGHPG